MRLFIIFTLLFCYYINIVGDYELSVSGLEVVSQQTQSSPSQPIWNTNWVATDDLGRSLPTEKETGPARAGKYVGIFYFLWHGEHYNKAIHDISKSIRINPQKPSFGPVQAFHWWGEPEAGYYRADDPWVIRRNLQMLSEAGIDVLFFDVTNGSTYLSTVDKVCKTSMQLRQQGIQTPYICFVLNSNTKKTTNELYQKIYAINKYSDVWFRWDGKPLLLGKQEEIEDPTQKAFFTWRYSWQMTDAKTQPGHWQWLDTTPQDYGWVNDPNVPEQMPVAVASHPIFNIGKSFSKGRPRPLNKLLKSDFTEQGLYFDEQWKQALKVDPKVVFVSGWNEWIAQRFVSDSTDRNMAFKYFMGHKMRQGESFFMDLYNEEYNRDIEPMKGGYGDNYYYQLVANVRRFKGMTPSEASSLPKSVLIDGKFSEWTAVKPIFKDFQGDVLHRNWLRFDNKIKLINKSGRNDFVESRVIFDNASVFFFVKTAKAISSYTDKNWMMLFINTDQSNKTGWKGYDVAINMQVLSRSRTTVSRWSAGKWIRAGEAQYQLNGDKMELKVSRSLLRIGRIPKFDFHWADNIRQTNSLSEFAINGDSAPDRRFNYRYIGHE